MTQIALAVHGGAGRLAKAKTQYPARKRYERAIGRALKAGQTVLIKGGSAINAVSAAVTVLEDEPLFNAGHGAAICADGSIELCASIMNGKNLSVGAMVGLKRVKNPVRAAQLLIKHTHGFLFGEHADAYGEKLGLPMVKNDYFKTEHRLKQWKKFKNRKGMVLDHSDVDSPHGTVGAVAIDRRGSLAAATSTGGLVNQMPGRVGDSPIIGSGTWADNNTCAVSATGTGEAFARVVFARRIADLVELTGMSAQEASTQALEEVQNVKGEGGCIVIDKTGKINLSFNSSQMLRGWIVGHGKPMVGILPNEEIEME